MCSDTPFSRDLVSHVEIQHANGERRGGDLQDEDRAAESNRASYGMSEFWIAVTVGKNTPGGKNVWNQREDSEIYMESQDMVARDKTFVVHGRTF